MEDKKVRWDDIQSFVMDYFENCSAEGILSTYNDITGSKLTMEDFEDEM